VDQKFYFLKETEPCAESLRGVQGQSPAVEGLAGRKKCEINIQFVTFSCRKFRI